MVCIPAKRQWWCGSNSGQDPRDGSQQIITCITNKHIMYILKHVAMQEIQTCHQIVQNLCIKIAHINVKSKIRFPDFLVRTRMTHLTSRENVCLKIAMNIHAKLPIRCQACGSSQSKSTSADFAKMFCVWNASLREDGPDKARNCFKTILGIKYCTYLNLKRKKTVHKIHRGQTAFA